MMSYRTLGAGMLLIAFGLAGAPPLHAATRAKPLHQPTDATVVSLSVVPASGRADVVIRVSGAVTYKHFTLTDPDKIVVDLSGATLDLPEGDAYDGVARGGITRVRYSQFTKSVVRVVLTLDAPHTYTVSQADGEIRVSVDGAAGTFTPWRVAGDGAADDRADAPQTASSDASSATTPPARTTTLAMAPAAPAAKSSARAPQQPTITYTWENANIADVLAMFSAYTGRTILPSRNVTGTITASINNLPWDVALKEIMNANGYDVTVNPDGVIVVDTFEAIAARQATTPLATRTVRLNYARALSILPMLQARLTRSCPQTAATAAAAAANGAAAAAEPGTAPLTCPTRGAVTADTVTNSVSITDVPSALTTLIDYARSMDLRQPQVNIKAKIILVDRTTLEGLGLRYDLGSQSQFFNALVPRLDSTGTPRTDVGQVALGGNAVAAIANATTQIPNAALELVYSTAIGGFDFTSFLEALQTTNLVDIQAEPSATVLNNFTANLTAGSQVPIRTIDAGSGGTATGAFPRAVVQMQNTGVILQVTPQITANRQIQMRVHVENSSATFQGEDAVEFPKQSVDNAVIVADGETAVMGGLTQTQVSVTKSGLPLLVDLPVIGRLFGVTQRQEEKRDLLILITPHIIDDGQQPDSPRR